MQESRRSLLVTFFGAASVFSLAPLLSALQAPGVHPSPPQPKPSPNTPNGNFPPGLKGPPVTTDSKVINKQNQEEIKSDVSRLYEMISELKEQVERSPWSRRPSRSKNLPNRSGNLPKASGFVVSRISLSPSIA
jgi:hypothetical protein